MGMPTLKVREVARKLSLSPGTVSKALNGSSGLVSVHTAQRVLDYCFKKGYLTKAEIDRTIFKIKMQSSYEDKAIFCATSYQGCRGFDVVFSCISDYLQDHGRYVTHFNIKEKGSFSRFPFSQVGAMVVLGHLDPEIFGILKASHVPLVLVDEFIEGEHVSSVNSDNLQSMSRAVEILSSCGHSRIAYMSLVDRGGAVYNQSQRRSGYILGMVNEGLDSTSLVFEREAHFDYSMESHGQIVEELRSLSEEILACDPRPTAIVASNDLSAHIIREVAREKKLRIPEDLSIIGHDGQHRIPMAGMYFEPVSTMVVDFQEMGREAVELAVGLSVDPAMRSRQLTVPTVYEENGTVAPPKSSVQSVAGAWPADEKITK